MQQRHINSEEAAAQMGYSSTPEATKKKTSLANSQWVSLISPILILPTHCTLQKIYYTPGRGKIVPRNLYTPGRGKIVPRNVNN